MQPFQRRVCIKQHPHPHPHPHPHSHPHPHEAFHQRIVKSMQPLLGVIMWNINMHKPPCKACQQTCAAQCKHTQPQAPPTDIGPTTPHQRSPVLQPQPQPQPATQPQRQPQPLSPHPHQESRYSSPLLYYANPAPAPATAKPPAPAPEIPLLKPNCIDEK